MLPDMHGADAEPEYLYRIETRRGQESWGGWVRNDFTSLIQGNVDQPDFLHLLEQLDTLASTTKHPDGAPTGLRFWYTEAGYLANQEVFDLLLRILPMNSAGDPYEVQVIRWPRHAGWTAEDELQVAYSAALATPGITVLRHSAVHPKKPR